MGADPTLRDATSFTASQIAQQYGYRHIAYGKAKLTVILAGDDGITLSESTVVAYWPNLRGGVWWGLVPHYLAATKMACKRQFTGHARRWAYDLCPQ
jgi:hypothetical protein